MHNNLSMINKEMFSCKHKMRCTAIFRAIYKENTMLYIISMIYPPTFLMPDPKDFDMLHKEY
jgi:hypothetical protein